MNRTEKKRFLLGLFCAPYMLYEFYPKALVLYVIIYTALFVFLAGFNFIFSLWFFLILFYFLSIPILLFSVWIEMIKVKTRKKG